VPGTLTKTRDTDLLGGNDGGGIDETLPYGGGDNDGAPRSERTPPPEGYYLAIRLTLVGVTALFTTLVVVYVWLAAQRERLNTPRLFWFSTGVVLACSLTLELSRRALRRRHEAGYSRWLWLTMALGLVFLGAQYLGLRQLTAEGFFATSNKRAWLAFLIIGSHGAHLVGGLAALIYLVVKNQYGDWTALRRRVTMDSTVLYWHFIDLLWLLLFGMVFLWK
jgi:cytochrome c oxidase subunit III